MAKLRARSRWALPVIASVLVGLTAGNTKAEDTSLRFSEPEKYWKTEKAIVLDSDVMVAKLVELGAAQSAAYKNAAEVRELPGEIKALILAELTDGKGVHVETALTALGSLAGFSCQMAIREDFVKSGKITLEQAFTTVGTADGQTYYMGDLLNEGLVATRKGNLSVWGIVAAAPHHLGKDLPDLMPIFKRTGATLGSDDFGVPDLPKRHMPDQMPIELLQKFWNVTRNQLVLAELAPSQWPYVISQAAQQLIMDGKDVLDPSLAARIVMEAAVPMSKVSPDQVPRATLEAASAN